MKKLFLTLVVALACVCANAQFEQTKKFIGASLSGMDMTFSDAKDFSANLDLTAGYFVANNFLVKGNLGYGYANEHNRLNAGLGARYYFQRNGIFVGTGGEINWQENGGERGHGLTLVNVPVEVGYALFINRHVTIEPSFFNKVCINKISDYSEVGFKIGFGVYF